MIKLFKIKFIIKKKSFLALLLLYIYIIDNKLKVNVYYITKSIKKNNTGKHLNLRPFKNLKNSLLQYLSEYSSKNITKVRNIFLGSSMRFGNQLTLIERAIFYCEILGCKNIILDKRKNWFIKNKIIIKKSKMCIKVNEEKLILNYNGIVIDKTSNFFYYKSEVTPPKRINILKNEIFSNLPKVLINKDDLFIYIRSGDIFSNNPHPYYIQPPSCYYEKILNNLNFRKIYLIAQDKFNPVIDNLLNKFKFIIYNNNPINIDISYLANAFIIIGGGTSTFFHQIISLNTNLQILYRYNNHYYRNLNYKKFYVKIRNGITIFEMFTSKEYLSNIFPWKNSDLQRKFMINFIC